MTKTKNVDKSKTRAYHRRMVNDYFDGRIPADMREHMEPQLDINDLGIAFSKLAEALCIELNVPCKRRYSHEELADSFRAIRQVNAEREGSK